MAGSGMARSSRPYSLPLGPIHFSDWKVKRRSSWQPRISSAMVPRPFDGFPPVMNAAGSSEGREFAVRNADYLFCISVDLDQSKMEMAQIHANAARHARATGAFTLSHVVCRSTRREGAEISALLLRGTSRLGSRRQSNEAAGSARSIISSRGSVLRLGIVPGTVTGQGRHNDAVS